MEPEREKEISGAAFLQHLEEIGILRKNSPTQRVIIDAAYDAPIRIYIQELGTTRLLKMAPPDVSGMQVMVLDKEGSDAA